MPHQEIYQSKESTSSVPLGNIFRSYLFGQSSHPLTKQKSMPWPSRQHRSWWREMEMDPVSFRALIVNWATTWKRWLERINIFALHILYLNFGQLQIEIQKKINAIQCKTHEESNPSAQRVWGVSVMRHSRIASEALDKDLKQQFSLVTSDRGFDQFLGRRNQSYYHNRIFSLLCIIIIVLN